MGAFEVAFVRALPHGLCVGIALPEDDAASGAALDRLLPAERAHAGSLAPARRTTFVGGRLALREALGRAGLDAPAVLPDDRGAPRLPAGIAGSISHKRALAVALVGAGDATLGVDVELFDRLPRADIARHVLTEDERPEVTDVRELLVRFSIKEAIYKAIDPHVRRFVGFQEVAVRPRPDGSVGLALRLEPPPPRPVDCECRWEDLGGDGGVLATARIRLRA